MKLPTSLPKRSIRWPFVVRRLHGHSMVPTLPPGTVVFGACWFLKPKPGQVLIIARDDREQVKRLERYDEDKLFMLGDHAETSTDSRHYGAIDASQVIAKVIWPRTPHPEV